MVSRGGRSTLAAAFVLALAAAAAGAASAAQQGASRPDAPAGLPITALAVSAPHPPQEVRGSDGRWHLEYDLVITNVFTADVMIEQIEVLDGTGRALLSLEGDALGAVTTEFLGTSPTRLIPPSTAVQTVVDVALPEQVRSRAGLPAEVTHRIRYELASDAPFHQLIGSNQVDGPVLRVDRRKPVVIAPPLRGSGWVAFNACCAPSSHRSFILSANGDLVTPEVFAIDWLQERDGRLAEGSGAENSEWYGHGAPVLAVADGTVVAAVDTMPEVAPGTTLDQNPTITDTDSFGGNHVLLRIRPGVYALFGHLITGSVQVEVGDRVRTGQQLGLLGNSGNTSAPHLHFGLIDGTALLGSNSLPFEIDRFTLTGAATISEDGDVTVTGSPREVRRAHPLNMSVTDFGE